MSYSITTMAVAKNVNAVRFTSDGSRVNIIPTYLLLIKADDKLK